MFFGLSQPQGTLASEGIQAQFLLLPSPLIPLPAVLTKLVEGEEAEVYLTGLTESTAYGQA